MLISNFGDLKAVLSKYMFHARQAPDYDLMVSNFERAANLRLRVRQMEAMTLLTTVNGEASLPDDYLTWRTVLPVERTRYPTSSAEMDYVHPAYLPTIRNDTCAFLFAIEGAKFKTRPINDAVGAYELHYYQKIPTITAGGDLATNWLLTEHPDAYEFGCVTELAAIGRNAEMAQLYKARRDEVLAEITQLSALTTGPTSPAVRTAEYY